MFKIAVVVDNNWIFLPGISAAWLSSQVDLHRPKC